MTDQRPRVMVAALASCASKVIARLSSMPSIACSTPGPGSATSLWGMARQGYDLQLTRYDEQGCRATFYMSGMAHSLTSATGTAWEPTPWRAVQGAAREAFTHMEATR